MEQRDTVSFVNAAAAGRLVVALLFAANGLAYFIAQGLVPVAGMALAILGGALGYFACSAAAFLHDSDKLTIGALACCVLSGIAFLCGA